MAHIPRMIIRGLFVLIFLTIPAFTYALGPIAPSMDGNIGVLRVISAKGLIQGGMCFYLNGMFYKTDGDYLNSDDILTKRAEARATIGYGLADWLEFSFGTRSSSTQFQDNTGKPIEDNTGKPIDVITTAGDVLGNLKFSYVSDPGLAIGLQGFIIYNSMPHLLGWNNYPTFGGRFLWTIDLDAARDVPLRFHLNLGYKVDRSRKLFTTKKYGDQKQEINWVDQGVLYEHGMTQSLLQSAYGIFNDDQVLGAVAIEIPTPYLTTFVEYTTEQVIDTNSNAKAYRGSNSWGVSPQYNSSPQRITPGLRFTPVPGWTLDIGADISLTKTITLAQTITVNAVDPSIPGNTIAAGTKMKTYPAWKAFAGLSYTYIPGTQLMITKEIAPPPPPPPSTGKISGIASDAASGQPLGNVIISFPGRPLTNLSTDALTGSYTSYEMDAGTVQMTAMKEGYEELSVTVEALAGLTVTQDLALKKLVQFGAAAGSVKDPQGNPLAAVISFDKPDVSPGATNPADGTYFIKLTPGEYQMTASVQGFKSQTKPVTIKDKIKTIVDFVLEPAVAAPPPPVPVVPEKKAKVFIQKKKIVITEAIHFETGKATILPVSYSLLNEVAQVIKNNPGIRVRIEGHTDSVGSAAYNLRLSDARAASVMRYLTSQAVDPDRLESRGYGLTMPIADNATAEGRAKNRRVEFTIISD